MHREFLCQSVQSVISSGVSDTSRVCSRHAQADGNKTLVASIGLCVVLNLFCLTQLLLQNTHVT